MPFCAPEFLCHLYSESSTSGDKTPFLVGNSWLRLEMDSQIGFARNTVDVSPREFLTANVSWFALHLQTSVLRPDLERGGNNFKGCQDLNLTTKSKFFLSRTKRDPLKRFKDFGLKAKPESGRDYSIRALFSRRRQSTYLLAQEQFDTLIHQVPKFAVKKRMVASSW